MQALRRAFVDPPFTSSLGRWLLRADVCLHLARPDCRPVEKAPSGRAGRLAALSAISPRRLHQLGPALQLRSANWGHWRETDFNLPFGCHVRRIWERPQCCSPQSLSAPRFWRVRSLSIQDSARQQLISPTQPAVTRDPSFPRCLCGGIHRHDHHGLLFTALCLDNCGLVHPPHHAIANRNLVDGLVNMIDLQLGQGVQEILRALLRVR